MDLGPIRPDGQFQVHEIGDNVGRRAAVDTGAGDHGEVFGACFFRDDGLQAHDDVGGGHDGVDAEVGP